MASKPKKSLIKILPSVWLLKTLTLLRILFGCYIEISKSRAIRFFIRVYCICFCSLVIAIYFIYHFNTNVNYDNFFILIEYTFTVIVYLIYGNEYFLNYCASIKTSDRIMGFKKISLIPNYLYIILIVNFALRLNNIIIRGIVTPSTFVFVSITSALIAMESNNIIVFIIFSILHSRMKLLRIYLNYNFIPINITGRNEVAISIKNVRKSLYYYNYLLESMECIDKQLRYSVFISCISHSIKILLQFYNVAKIYVYNASTLLMIVTFFVILHSLLFLTCLSIISEATIHEVDQIKKTLSRQIVRCSDQCLRFELETMLQYVSLRPFRYTICRAVRLDIKLPLTFIGLCITYVIVIMQITHLIV